MCSQVELACRIGLGGAVSQSTAVAARAAVSKSAVVDIAVGAFGDRSWAAVVDFIARIGMVDTSVAAEVVDTLGFDRTYSAALAVHCAAFVEASSAAGQLERLKAKAESPDLPLLVLAQLSWSPRRRQCQLG